jgi:N-acetylneuraminic acid mutarotase
MCCPVVKLPSASRAAPRPCMERIEGRVLLAAQPAFEAHINFQPPGPSVASGYDVDSGQPLGPQSDGLTYGWDRDLSGRARSRLARSPADPRYATCLPMGKATWNLAVPNGVYTVHLAAGDPRAARGVYKIDVEGTPAIDSRARRKNPWIEGNVVVNVTDGMLTVTGRSKANRIDFVDVVAGGEHPGSGESVFIAGPSSPQGRVEAGVARVGSKLYVFGGFVKGLAVDNRTDIFDAATGQWTRGHNFPGSETHAGVTSDGQRYIYKSAGQIGGSIPGKPTNQVWRLDTTTDKWSRLPDLPEPRYAGALEYLDDKLYFFGGDEPDRTTTTTNLWVLDLKDTAAGWTAKAPLPLAGDHMSGAVIGGKIYSIGGEHGHANSLPDIAPYVQHNYLFAYDPAADQWTRLADLPVGRSHAEGTTLVVNDKIVLMGGKLGPQDASDRIDVYDPVTNQWTAAGTLPKPDQGGASIFYNGQIYVTDGQEGAPRWTMWTNMWVGLPAGV